ncbi:hypothetical protein BDV10DRAFT_186201 [Aspergillus recurvatus]
MSTPEQTRMKTASPRFYRQYIDENDSLSAAPRPASSLPANHLRAPSSPFTRSETSDAAARAQPRRSLDIASKALGIRSSTPATADAVKQSTTPLLDTRPTPTLHLPNGRVLPPLSPTAPSLNSRSRSSSLGQTGSQHVSKAAGTSHNRSASHTIFPPTPPTAILHPLRPPYRNARSDPLPVRNPLSSPVITVREPSPPPSESRPAFLSQSRSRNNSVDVGETGTGQVKLMPEETPASSGRRETRSLTSDALADGGSSLQSSDSRPSLEGHIRNRNHSLNTAAGRRSQQTDANAPSPCLEAREPTPDDINAATSSPSPPAQRSSLESRSGRHSRSQSMEFTRTNHGRRPYHRASTQSLQMAKPTLISITAKDSSSETNSGSAQSSLETLTRPANDCLDLPKALPQQPDHGTSTQSLQARVRKPFLDTAPITVTRLTPLNSHPPSPIKEQAHTRSQSLDTNDHSGPPAAPSRPKHASLPVPSIRSSSPASSSTDAAAVPATDSEPPSSQDADSAPPIPIQLQTPAQSLQPADAAISTPTVSPPIPPAFSAPKLPDHPPPPPPRQQPQPRSETLFTSRTFVPAPSALLPPAPSITDQSPSPHLEARQRPPRPSLSNFTTQSLITLRAATASISAFQTHSPSTFFSSPSSKSTSSSSSNSTTSTATASIPTPQSPPVPVPSPANPSDIPLTALTQHVQNQLSQARNLFSSLSHHLTSTENNWIHDTITDTEAAVREILILTESLRVDREVNNGRLGLKTQFRWVVRDSRKAKDKRARLVLCHASLVAVLVRLQGVKVEYAGDGTGYAGANAKAEMGASDNRLMPSANGRVRGPTMNGLHSPSWDPAVQLQDPGMEWVVGEPTGPEARSRVPQSPTSTTSGRESIEPAQGKLDNELLDMLSWRWAQGRTKTTTTQ